MAHFYRSARDLVVATHTYNTVDTEIRCNPEGVFYAEFADPPELLKDRSQPKLRKAIEAAVVRRGVLLGVPFVRVKCEDDGTIDWNNYIVTEIDDRGNGKYTDEYHRRRSINSLYDSERYLRVLAPDERKTLEGLHGAARAAIRAVDEWLDAREFDLKAALTAQKAGTYPTEHQPIPEWDDEAGDGRVCDDVMEDES